MKQRIIQTCGLPVRYKRVVIPCIISFIWLGLAVSSCASWFGTPDDSQIPTIAAPPQKTNANNNASPAPSSSTNNASGTVKAQQVTKPPQEVPRIQEERENGVVDEIKVNNRNNLPSYYIYPTKQQNNGVNRIPDQNVSAPNWQISW